jgi:hypothetical protein
VFKDDWRMLPAMAASGKSFLSVLMLADHFVRNPVQYRVYFQPLRIPW